MKVSEIENTAQRKNAFIQYSNSFMSMKNAFLNKDNFNKIDEPVEKPNPSKRLGIENIQEFSIYPKETIDGKMIITA